MSTFRRFCVAQVWHFQQKEQLSKNYLKALKRRTTTTPNTDATCGNRFSQGRRKGEETGELGLLHPVPPNVALFMLLVRAEMEYESRRTTHDSNILLRRSGQSAETYGSHPHGEGHQPPHAQETSALNCRSQEGSESLSIVRTSAANSGHVLSRR
ncbi:hypothetical protein J6590_002159 [Homalodisca vitripennis]|nr:hypothetical protein J6590_002159 [Homalodisca vitripennis]